MPPQDLKAVARAVEAGFHPAGPVLNEQGTRRWTPCESGADEVWTGERAADTIEAWTSEEPGSGSGPT
jgi:hypothetical protein